MEKLLEIILYILATTFWIGLIKPSLVGMPNRKRSSLIYFLTILVFAGAKEFFYPHKKSPEELDAERLLAVQSEQEAKKFKYPTTTLREYRSKPKQGRKDIVADYLNSQDINESASASFYNCLSEFSVTKNDDLQIDQVLGWCSDDYKKDLKYLDNRTNFDEFLAQFNHWDGSYRPLEKVIKEGMNDEGSYKHIKTTYRVILKGSPHAIVSTTFSGTNAYAARVKQTIFADVDINTGQIISIIEK